MADYGEHDSPWERLEREQEAQHIAKFQSDFQQAVEKIGREEIGLVYFGEVDQSKLDRFEERVNELPQLRESGNRLKAAVVVINGLPVLHLTLQPTEAGPTNEDDEPWRRSLREDD